MFPSSAEDLLRVARSVASQAGELIVQRRREGVVVAASKSSLEDVVTQADQESEMLIRRLLEVARPEDGFFGEEGNAVSGSSGLTWVVDPIDGTVNYLYGIPMFAVSVAVVEGDADPLSWRALAGAVVNPMAGDVFTAHAGGGAHLNGERIRVREQTDLSQALVGTGFSYSADERRVQGARVASLLGEVRDIRRQGAAALDLCSVACGRLDAYYEVGTKPWDHAAGALIAAEAGARVSGWEGRPASAELVLAANPKLAAQLESKLAILSTS